MMEHLWFIIISGMLVTYVVLDGFDLGVGLLYKWVAPTAEERSVVRRSIGPVWDANEVWLLATGGTLYLAFPALYASSFSGFYLPLMMVLWLLIGRGLGLELRGHLPDPLAKEICDTLFMVSSLLLTIVLGAALGNVVRGVPLDAEGYFFLPLWTSLWPGANPGVLDLYTILCGVVALVALGTHGAHYLVLKTTGEVHQRSRRVALWGSRLLPFATVASLVATMSVRRDVLANFRTYPAGALLPLVVIGSLAMMNLSLHRRRERAAFAASCTYLIAMLGGAAFALYPVLLLSVPEPSRSLTIASATTGSYGMRVAMTWWLCSVVLVAATFRFLYGRFRGKILPGTEEH
jgi:cytochrome d ubiquinol oxidase subunit II